MSKFDEASKTWEQKQSSIDNSSACIENLKKYIKLKDDANILDYGCGTGFLAFALKNPTNNILGMDSSSGMIDKFNEKAEDLNLENIKAIKHDMNIDDIQHNTFDLFISSMTMHHIKDTKMFAQKTYNCLKEGAIACINDLLEEDGTFHSDNEGVEHFGFSKENLYEIFKDVGFKIISCDIVYSHQRNTKEYPMFNLIVQK